MRILPNALFFIAACAISTGASAHMGHDLGAHDAAPALLAALWGSVAARWLWLRVQRKAVPAPQREGGQP